MTIGAFSPPTKGHSQVYKTMIDEAEQAGAVPVVAVSKGEGRTGDVGLTIPEKERLIKEAHPEVTTLPTRGAGVPEVIRMDGQLVRAQKENSKVFLGSDRAGDSVGERFRKQGLPVVGVERATEETPLDDIAEGMEASGISATRVRQALLSGNVEDAEKMLEPRTAEVLTRPENVRRLRERNKILEQRNVDIDDIDRRVKNEFGNANTAMINAGLMAPGAKPVTTIRDGLKAAHESGEYPEISAAVNAIRNLRANEKTRIKREADKRVSTMSREDPIDFASGGFVPSFASGFVPNF